jgi:glycosyltransferase involved in cell wall biosynthesis
MRVLIVSQYFWPESFRINDLATGLAERGHQVTVLTGKPNYPEGQFFRGYGFLGHAYESYGSINVIRVPLVPRGAGGSLRLAVNYLSFALFATALGLLRCKGQYDLIFAYQPSPVLVGIPTRVLKWIKGAPVMFWVQDLWPETLVAVGAVRSKLALSLVSALVRWIYAGCDRVLVQSTAFIEPIHRMGVERVDILYLPNSAEDFYRPAVSQEGGTTDKMPDGFRVMFAGNIGVAQSFETILAAALQLKTQQDIHWIILGEGRRSAWVTKEVERLGLSGQVHFFGRHPPEAMSDWFAQADVMLVTLTADPVFALTVPSKVQSYLACAKPIIAALDGEGARVIGEAGAGIAVPAEDADALAQAVQKMYRMPAAARQAMGICGRAFFERNYERDMLLDRLDGWMEALINEAQGGKP